MTRRTALVCLTALFFVVPAWAQSTCNLQINVSCPTLRSGQGGVCTAVTTNIGTNVCSGEYITGFFIELPPSVVQLSGYDSGIGLTDCFDSSITGADSEPFVICFGAAALAPGGKFTSRVTVTATAQAPSEIPLIGITAVYDSTFEQELAFVYAFANATLPTCTPTLSSPPVTESGVDYVVSWSEVSDLSATFTLEESTSPNFDANLVSQTVSGRSKTFKHFVTTGTTYYYRVRANSCAGGTPSFSATASTVVQGPPPPQSKTFDTIVPFGSTSKISFNVFIPGPTGAKAMDSTTYTASTDKSYLSVSPSSGTLPPSGTTVTVTADPKDLPPGANTGTVNVATALGTKSAVPVSVSLVTPVSSGGKSQPPGNALIIPIVTHVNGVAGPFLSDVRMTNANSGPVTYQVTFTPTRTNGTQSGKITTVTVESGRTIALNDIVKDFFGIGATASPSDAGAGTLEIRPQNSSSNLTYASSRTYASTVAGTFGQFIAAVPFTQFASRVSSVPLPGGATPSAILSLQQVAQSSKFRTNLGIVEGSGAPATGTISVYDDLGTRLASVPFSLQPGEHRQMNSFIAAPPPDGAGLQSLEDGRIEINLESPTGAVTAYASVLDNKTTDPFAVMPVQVQNVSAKSYVLPGMAEFTSSFSNFHSDIRIFNGGTTSANVTVTYYPQGAADKPVTSAPFTIGANQVRRIDNVIPTLFNLASGAGSLVVSTAANSSLVATGSTYSINATGGTFGQFIPGVSSAQGIGLGDKPLQILQLEESVNFRSNVGLVEVSGKDVSGRLTLVLPDSTTSPVLPFTLKPFEFVQYGKLIQSMLGPTAVAYNARVIVEVTGGSGRLAAYGSIVDNATSDPTYVPAQ